MTETPQQSKAREPSKCPCGGLVDVHTDAEGNVQGCTHTVPHCTNYLTLKPAAFLQLLSEG